MEISFTKLRVYRECPWKYQLQFVAGWRIPLTPAGSLGLSLQQSMMSLDRAGGTWVFNSSGRGILRKLPGADKSFPLPLADMVVGNFVPVVTQYKDAPRLKTSVR